MWHQWFNRNFTKLREYFFCAKKTKITTLFNNSSPPCHPIGLAPFWRVSHVNNICCSVSAAPYTDTPFMLWSERKQHILVHTLFTYVIGWVINDRIFIFGWTIPLSEYYLILNISIKMSHIQKEGRKWHNLKSVWLSSGMQITWFDNFLQCSETILIRCIIQIQTSTFKVFVVSYFSVVSVAVPLQSLTLI